MSLQHSCHRPHSRPTASVTRWPALAVTVALHAVTLTAVLSYAPARQSLAEIAPIMVSLLQPQALEKPVPHSQPRPQPQRRSADPDPQPLLAAPADTPAPAAVQAALPPQPLPQEPATARNAPAAAAVTPPQFNADYLNNPAPRYPALSIRLREEGTVMLRVQVDELGLPARVELRTSSGFERLDSVAQETVRHWKFVPARRGDQPVTAWVLVPISFTIRS